MTLSIRDVLRRIARGIREQTALAGRAGLSQSYLGSVMRGTAQMGRKGVVALAQAIGAKVVLDEQSGEFLYEVPEKRIKELAAEIAQEAAKAKEESRG